MQISDEDLRGRTVVAADGRTIGEVAAVLLTPPRGLSPRSRSSWVRLPPSSLVLPRACFGPPQLSYLSDWSSR